MDRTKLQKIYDGFANTYEDNRDQFDIDEIIQTYMRKFNGKTGEALDLGCGAGILLAKTFIDQGWKVTGVDFSQKMLELAAKYVPQMDTHLADFTQVQFHNEMFEAVTAVYSLFHLPRNQHASLFKNILDWLKPGGLALFTYATKEYTGSDVFDGYKEFLGENLYYSHDTPEVLTDLLTGLGFKIESKKYHTIAGETFLWVTIGKPVRN